MTATSAATTLKQDALGDLEHELATTRRVLERVPEEHFPWKPHEKSMTLSRLATHVVDLVHWQTMTLQSQELDLGGGLPPDIERPPASREALLSTFDANVAALKEALAQASEPDLRQVWTLRMGEKVLLRMPRLAVLRTMCLSHMINHRGQLCVYLRLLGVPVPSIYGPSADEPGF
jgi:uncharacterized damage-inducible protein DinB